MDDAGRPSRRSAAKKPQTAAKKRKSPDETDHVKITDKKAKLEQDELLRQQAAAAAAATEGDSSQESVKHSDSDVKSDDKLDAGKQDGGKQDGGKQDGGKQEGGKQDGAKQDGGKQDGGKTAEAKTDVKTERRPTRKPATERAGGRGTVRAAAVVTPAPILRPPKGMEMDFGLHTGHLESPLMTFESTVRALIKTLKHGSEIALPTQNMSSCADCRGGGDLLCCDCCQFSFHVDCLEPLERGSFLQAPLRKQGLKDTDGRDGGRENGRGRESRTDVADFLLTDSEWYCPYCLSVPVQRYWKRGVPQFMKSFTGFPDEVTEGYHSESHRGGVLGRWCDDVQEFMSSLGPDDVEIFPPHILLAMTGIRRAIQRLGPTFQVETKAEVEKLQKEEQEAATEDEDMAEPDVKDETGARKASIMKGKDRNIPSDEVLSETEVRKPKPAERSRRGRAKTIVPTPDEPEQLETARMNIGANFQVPGIHKFLSEALDFGCNYAALDHHSVYAYLPRDSRSFIPVTRCSAKNTCRLVYSVSELQKKQAEILQLTEGDNDPARLNCTIPLADDELNLYCHQALTMWPAWIQWPSSPEYALKILHHCRYDAREALRLLCTDGMQFKPICDPPVRPYMNKWKPRDKRGMISAIPFPMPSTALSFAGLKDVDDRS
ncbi:hypothetical protein GNI_067840 [Gregarina niphandrodes]|uniref:Zinc finger PHD-type domain-containing protein n=1 Tax=Gregarina niphandrodes TaxID=110365 RepID=A0A023B7L0_GRENI|nr:hypothetical protein GNI_067840 [Gregarina niphandrodes]EZG67544.1 hypothetical protein GNI_067840 [Gregarina niphandrodes]|eukprot:XP_011130205.1 hypothetical protein GNI_067840 [Gregarina niphandrodes]